MTTQNKFILAFEFPDETVKVELEEHEWNSIETAAKELNQTIEEFVLAAIEAAIEKYN